MPNIRECITKELRELVKDSQQLFTAVGQKDFTTFRMGYQLWYTRALAIVRQLIPDRLDEFRGLYEEPSSQYALAKFFRRKSISVDQYTNATMRVFQQSKILESAQVGLDPIFASIEGSIQAEIMDSELDAAYELWNSGHLRAAGVLAGVVLERHLAKACESRSLKVDKRNPTLSDWNDSLKNNNVYDMPVWRGIQRFIDIRNMCAHPKDREPDREEVRELIEGVEKTTKTVF